MSHFRAWGLSFLLCTVGAPFGVVGALVAVFISPVPLTVVLVAPVEEILKVLVVLLMVERRSPLIISSVQIVLLAAYGGFLFSAVENLLYAFFYFPGKASLVWSLRWVTATPMHVGASAICGLGLVRLRRFIRKHNRYEPEPWLPYYGIAVALHAGWNLLALLLCS